MSLIVCHQINHIICFFFHFHLNTRHNSNTNQLYGPVSHGMHLKLKIGLYEICMSLIYITSNPNLPIFIGSLRTRQYNATVVLLVRGKNRQLISLQSTYMYIMIEVEYVHTNCHLYYWS